MEENTSAQKQRGFSWFPGHMRKALRQLEESLNLADIVLLVMDARIPAASRQPDLEELLQRKHKELIFVLNKTDLAEEAETKKWLAWFKANNLAAVAMRSTAGKGAGPLEGAIARLRRSVEEKRRAKGLRPRDPRLVVAGIPNVGKSSLLNRLAGATRAKTGAKPGVTRGSQWVAVPNHWQILDSPGILYPRIDTVETLTALAAASCVRHDAIPLEMVGGLLLERLWAKRKVKNVVPASLAEKWKSQEHLVPEQMLIELATAKNFSLNGQEADLPRCARFVLKAFAQGEVGPITLETAPTIETPTEQA
ncbi:MAG: ribosome biogenesis GTPase YlqF [Candidatus Bruticola sp.]